MLERYNRQRWIWSFSFRRRKVKKSWIYEWGKLSNNQWRTRSKSNRSKINSNEKPIGRRTQIRYHKNSHERKFRDKIHKYT